ncbi:potassium-transporting ATPase subunit F [Exiguobacterium sp. A1_3_1]|uniref:Potassium-transporting ATPase subunit F n=1 Tax=Exiguobacterium acetylicum TaxID=41170 RepID=A0ABX8GF24_EXIAC|nr:potassium-transporting ATPase subunit F [Exiguobacterium sp. TBG-PICH-001]NTY10594.1 potassium-transporting ATPase subunit F [Exiguobacterium sp. JMULE1]QWB31767.1 potassium-transporting ATPase subunit F [Exiguobacterium acetylicum]RJO98190.1 potassium-transporting ATPase subunit F [Exiguobacterium sp. RIT452]HBQ75882.1 potassium-transporting ATPase subunit F [Exiguobacterium sp.]
MTWFLLATGCLVFLYLGYCLMYPEKF